VIVVDSSGWLEFFADGPNAGIFAPCLQDPERLIVPTISIYEVFKRVARQTNEESAVQAIAGMHLGHVIDLSERLALEAALVSLKHKLPMADSIILATAYAYSATLWSQDTDFLGLPGVCYVSKQGEVIGPDTPPS
jgi:predicted nucleic acid-binding protein